MPQDLPGFYYDPEKNRYFPIKGPIPGSASSNSRRAPSSSKPEQVIDQHDTHRRKRIRTAELLQARELYGKVFNSNPWKCDFKGECQKIQASQPVIWKYQDMDRVADSGLEQFYVDIQTTEGQHRTSALLMGSMRGSLSLYEVGQVGQRFYEGFRSNPDCVWPLVKESRVQCLKAPSSIWKPRTPMFMRSNISCIKRTGKHSPHMVDASSAIQHALIATLGSETSGGSVYIMKLDAPLDFTSRRRIFDVASLNCTIWTVDCSPNGFQAVMGTNVGVASVNLETGVLSWLCRSRSDVFSLQFDQSGNVILCGFRNGAIVTIDVRQRQRRLPKRGIHQSPQTYQKPSNKNAQNLAKRCFEIRGNIVPSCTTHMPSSISSLVSLQMYDQYFLSSSMDGSIMLYDHRQMQKGAIQSYDGHVNSHNHIQLGVDSAERLVISGGEDGKVRVWSIKTGELLFAEKISNSVPTTVCCPGTGELTGLPMGKHNGAERLYEQDQSWGAWLGSGEELFYMHW